MTHHEIPATVFIAVHATGEQVPVEVRIGVPRFLGPNEWESTVSVAGLADALPPTHGADPLQTLLLALDAVRRQLVAFVDDGGRLTFESGEEVPLTAYFARHERVAHGNDLDGA